MEAVGKHVIWDMYADPWLLSDVTSVRQWLDAVVNAAGMEPLGPPQVYVLENTDPTGPGITAFQPIVTSHVSIHTFPERGTLNADLFSCKDTFDEAELEALLVYYFAAWRLTDPVVLTRYGGPVI